jgi:hypothetical protein
MTDALGGVDVRVAETVRDPARKVVWPAGTHHLDGAQALDFVRQRYNLLRSLAVQFRAVRRDDLVFMTAPVAGTGTEDGGQSVVYLDRARSRPLYRALRSDAVDRYVTAAGDAVNQVDEVR